MVELAPRPTRTVSPQRERRFLVNGPNLPEIANFPSTIINEAYIIISRDGREEISVRSIMQKGAKEPFQYSMITQAPGQERTEELIDEGTFRALFSNSEGRVVLYSQVQVPFGDIKIFGTTHVGTVVADLNVDSREVRRINRNEWMGREVTGVRKYTNKGLAQQTSGRR